MTDLSVYSSKVDSHEPIFYKYEFLRKLFMLFGTDRQFLVDCWLHIYSLDKNALNDINNLSEFLLTQERNEEINTRTS